MNVKRAGFLGLALLFSGCFAESPLTPGQPETVDTSLLGKWRCIGFDADAQVGTLTVTRKDSKTYRIEVRGEHETRSSHWEAFTVTVDKHRLANVRDLDPTNAEPWTLLPFSLYRPNLLHLEVVRYEEWEVRRKEVQKALLGAGIRETLFEDYLACVRLKES